MHPGGIKLAKWKAIFWFQFFVIVPFVNFMTKNRVKCVLDYEKKKLVSVSLREGPLRKVGLSH